MRTLCIGVVLSALTFGVASAQNHDHSAAAAAKPAPAPRTVAVKDGPEEIFCGSMKTGQLCSTGTTTLLNLTGEKREAWLDALREYNRAVNSAIMALQAQARTNLSASQVAEVDRWFAVGINPQINDILAATAKAGSK